MKNSFLITCVCGIISGCQVFSHPPSSIPVIEDRVGRSYSPFDLESPRDADHDMRIGTLATVAQRRIVLVRFKDAKFCAEPSPDAADNISSAVSMALSGANPKISVSAELASNLATYAKSLGVRSQGVQLYRDGMFALCNMYLNGMIATEEKYLQEHKALLTAVEKLIDAEIAKGLNANFDQGSNQGISQPDTRTSAHAEKDKTNPDGSISTRGAGGSAGGNGE